LKTNDGLAIPLTPEGPVLADPGLEAGSWKLMGPDATLGQVVAEEATPSTRDGMEVVHCTEASKSSTSFTVVFSKGKSVLGLTPACRGQINRRSTVN
jgi:hypothetical protein